MLVLLRTSKVVHDVSVELEALSLEVVCAVSSEAVRAPACHLCPHPFCFHDVSDELDAPSLEVVRAVSSEAVRAFSLARPAFDSGQGHPLLR